MDTFNFFLPLSKVEKNKDGSCTVAGYASTPSIDLDGEIVSLDAVKAALPGYWEWRNIREMHQPRAVGVAKEANVDDKGLFLTSRITDKEAAQKCLDQVYKGYSIGGKKLSKQGNIITEIELIEVSLVDRPANPDCRIELSKRAKDGDNYLIKTKPSREPAAKAIAKMAQAVELMSKAGPKAAHDGFSLPAGPESKVPLPKDPHPNENITRKDGGIACKEHGKVDCAECAGMDKRDVGKDERKDLAGKGDANPDGSFPIKNKSDLANARQAIGRSKNPGKTRALIRRRAKELGVKLPSNWKKKLAKKLIKKAEKKCAKAAAIADLGKSMSVIPPLSSAFDSIRNSQRSLIMESKREKDGKDKKLAEKLGSISNDLAAVIGQKATHEGSEAIDYSDADDQWIQSYLTDGDEDEMTQKTVQGAGLDQALATLVKKAMMPSRASRMNMAKANIQKARKMRKECSASISKAHGMLKAVYLSKTAGSKKKEEMDDDMDNMEKVMGELQKAHTAMENMKTFHKAAEGHIEKLSRAGQRGQEAADSEPGFYEVPPGVKDMTPDAMASSPPGARGGGSMPPAYPDSGQQYPGKAAKFAKGGMVPVEVAELMAENARLSGQVAALDRLPSGRGKPHVFDLNKTFNGGGQQQDRNSLLFDGVNTNLLNAEEESIRTPEIGKVVGNYLLSGRAFGKSILDPSFKGSAGNGKRSA